jgi:hypothetical protein
MRHSWLGNMMKSWTLAMEASHVVVLRSMKIAAGGSAAKTEMELMVQEKIDAFQQLQTRASAGKLSSAPQAALGQSLDHYGRKVTANRRRLSGRG